MKNINLIKLAIAGSLIPTAVIALYFVNFWGTGLSGDPKDWADFGTYVGGVLSPVFAAAAAILALTTHRNQLNRFAAEELRDAIEKQDSILERELSNTPIELTTNNSTPVSLFTVLTRPVTYASYLEALPRYKEYMSLVNKIDEGDEPEVKITFGEMSHILIVSSARLRHFHFMLIKHTAVSHSNALEVLYRHKYAGIVRVLKERGWYDGVWLK